MNWHAASLLQSPYMLHRIWYWLGVDYTELMIASQLFSWFKKDVNLGFCHVCQEHTIHHWNSFNTILVFMNEWFLCRAHFSWNSNWRKICPSYAFVPFVWTAIWLLLRSLLLSFQYGFLFALLFWIFLHYSSSFCCGCQYTVYLWLNVAVFFGAGCVCEYSLEWDRSCRPFIFINCGVVLVNCLAVL